MAAQRSDTPVQPAFLFSLPRSGSTLLQRLLSAHPDVATSPEPWILLPAAQLLGADVGDVAYDPRPSRQAFADFADTLPGGRDEFVGRLRDAFTGIYASAAQGAPVFLDKTPRYHLILPEIDELFPDAPRIVLWRNPLAVAASHITTWGDGKWVLPRYDVDLRRGLANLVDYVSRRDDVTTVRYEDLVSNAEAALPRCFAALSVDPPDGTPDLVDLQLGGRMGDQIGTARFTDVSTASVDSWTAVLANPLRRRWARRYLEWIGPDRLAVMGYSFDELVRTLNELPLDLERTGSDALRMPLTRVWSKSRYLVPRDSRLAIARMGSKL